jgi:DNA (cytosine-5)-methyltransferase 1
MLGGFKTVQFVETNSFCQQVLCKHWPEVPIHDDVQTFHAQRGSIDVITAGFPCQDLSSAGKQAGLGGERSGLFYEVIRLARELQPRFIVFENVANLVSHKDGETFQEVLYQIARAGFDAEWAVVSARDVGACHLRKRVWIVAYAAGKCGDDVRLENAGQASESELRNSNCADAADAQSRGDIRQDQHAGQPLFLKRMGKQGVLNTPDSDDERLQRRESAGVCKHAAEWTAWSGNPPGCGLSADWRGYVSEPVLCRGDDGLSGRVDRLKALGNAVVPQAAMVPLRRVLELAA